MDREEGEPASGGNGTTPDNENGTPEPGAEDSPDGATDPEEDQSGDQSFIYRHLEKEEAQHAWNRYIAADEDGVPQPPRHHVVVLADYTGTGPPTETERATMERTLAQLEEAYEWSNDGLVFTVGYSPAYFDRFEADLPAEVDLPEPAQISQFDSPTLDSHDISIHLASDHAQAVLGAEEMLFGTVENVHGVSVEESLETILDKRDRRTGFVGRDLPAQHQDVEGIPDSEPVPPESPLYMGFESQSGVMEVHPYHGETDAPFVANQNSEYGVMIKEGRFEGGTTQHLSHLRLTLGEWYENHSVEQRLDKMFEGVGQNSPEVLGEFAQRSDEARLFKNSEDFREGLDSKGVVGHMPKMSQARENGIAPLLRRDFDTTDGDHAGVHFISLQEEISDFVHVRTLMDGAGLASEIDGIEERHNNGILEFITTKSRANFLIPPRHLRALPRPR